MLKSTRFTTLPTKDCVARLEAALANEQPIARGERHRGAVISIQSALADLNSAYLLVAEIDGYYGARTSQAVEAFQRDYGLIADGMIGKQTMTQLDVLYSGAVIRKPRGLSVHVGVNYVDPAHYGSDFPLASCVNDSRKMKEMAESLGYEAVIFENENATCSNFTGFIRRAISDLYAGDSLLVTFSGHGSQVPNASPDVESDNMDETLCFFDRMFLDDEFYELLSQFRQGVRINAVFDSCHSGTVAKKISDIKEEREIYEKNFLNMLKAVVVVEEDYQPVSGGAIEKALEGESPDFMTSPQTKNAAELDKDIVALFGGLFENSNSLKPKRIELVKTKKGLINQIYEEHKNVYDSIKNVVGPVEDKELLCSVITVSACLDSQTTQAGPISSVFTSNIVDVWNYGTFSGNYMQFLQKLKDISPSDATPEVNTYGTNMANARLYDRPFVF